MDTSVLSVSLQRIPSVHSMRDIPFAGPASPSHLSTHHSVSSLADLTDHSSRLVSVSDCGPTQPKHSSIIKLDDLHSLYRTRNDLKAHIERYGPTTINAIILASVFERINEGFVDVLPQLFASDDPAHFANSFYPLRDIVLHLQRIGPMGNCLPRASQLNSLIKWDFRQLINSFLTLIRTSPGFVATAYMELAPMDRKLFLGCQRGDLVDEVISGQRLCPLGIMFSGLIRDRTQRINYFAAMCSQLLYEDQERPMLTLMSKFAKMTFLYNEAATKLDLKLRRLIRHGRDSSPPQTASTGTTTTTASLSITTPQDGDFWAGAVTELLEILRDYVSADFSLFVATLCDYAPSLQPMIHAAALKCFRQLVRQLLAAPHTYGVLEDFYVNEGTHKLLQTLAHMSCDAIGADELFKGLLWGKNLQLGDTQNFFDHNQLIVLSLSDIVFLYNSLLPSKRIASPQATADDNEWCLDNIRSDLEPVMKELSVKLPASRSRIVKDQQGIFMEYWQVFKIEQDGLVNDMDSQSWSPESTGAQLVVPEYADISTILSRSISEAEARGNFLDVQALRRLQGDAKPLNALVHELEKYAQILTSHKQELHNIMDQHIDMVYQLKRALGAFSKRLQLARTLVWYEQEVRMAPPYFKSQDVVNLLKGEQSLQRSNSGSSMSSRRFSSRPTRRLSILSGTSVMDSFFVSKDYLFKPKLADREIELTLKYLRSNRVQNFCRSEELIHRFNCELSMLLARILDKDFLGSGSTCFKRDTKQATGSSSHRMSMSVLPDLSSSRSRSRKSSPNLLLDIFEWKSSDSTTQDYSMGLECDEAVRPDHDMLCGLLLSDLGADFLAKGSETDEFMQQTGRMLLDGDGQAIQPILEHISLQTTPRKKLEGFETLVAVARASLEHETGLAPSRHDVTYELSKLFGREPGTLFADLQVVAGFVPASCHDNLEAGQPFWDVAEAALKILDQVVGKSMDLATRMLRYNESNKSSSIVSSMGVNDAVAIWSFCARHGRSKAQRTLAELYLTYPNALLDVLPFTKPAILFEGIEPTHVRNAVVAHWMQAAAHKGEPRAVEYCKQLQKTDFI